MPKVHIAGNSAEIVAGRVAEDGDDDITAAMTLPVSVWEQVTDWINDLHQWPGEDRPDIPLHLRIAEFLDLQTQIWVWEAQQLSGEPLNGDLDDDVPF